MSGKFRARGALPLHTAGVFGVYGEITDGVVRVGQIATGPAGFRARVHGVEFMRHPGGAEDLVLTFPLPADAAVPSHIMMQMAGGDLSLWETEAQADADAAAG